MIIDFYTFEEIKTKKSPNDKNFKVVNDKLYKAIKEIEETIKLKRNLQALYRRNELVVIKKQIQEN